MNLGNSYLESVNRLFSLLLITGIASAASVDRFQTALVVSSSVSVSSSIRVSSSTSPSSSSIGSNPLDSAQRYYALGKFQDAERWFRSISPSNTNSRIWAIRSSFQSDPENGRLRARLAMDSLLMELEPENSGFAEAFLLSSQLHAATGHPDLAARDWKRARQAGSGQLSGDLQLLCKQIAAADTAIAKECPGSVKAGRSSIGRSSSAAQIQTSSAISLSSSSTEDRWTLQLGAFSKRENADLLVRTLAGRKISASIVQREKEDKVLWLVQSGSFPSRDSANTWAIGHLGPMQLDFRPVQSP